MLTGERGHYELAAGGDAGPFLSALERFAQGIGLIPEQIWDAPDLPSQHLRFGGLTGSAIPLVWAHAEYLKLQRSATDGKVFDLVQPVFERYARGTQRQPNEVWKFNRQVPMAAAGTRLRIQATSPFLLHWTGDGWRHSTDTPSRSTAVEIEFGDLYLPEQTGPIHFTFLWVEENRWEGKDYTVKLQTRTDSDVSKASYDPINQRRQVKLAPAAALEALERTKT